MRLTKIYTYAILISMGIITDIQVQKKNPSRVSVFIDGEFFCGLDDFTALKHRLKIGEAVNEEILAQAVLDSESSSAFEKSMGIIDIRLRTALEVQKYLQSKLYSEEVIELVLAKLKSYGYIDDTVFAQNYIRSKRKTWGRLKIVYSLKQAGVAQEVIDAVLQETPNQQSEAYALAVKYTGQKAFDKHKTYAYLMRKGFDSDTIKAAIQQILENE